MRRCSIFAPSLTWTSWKWTVLDWVAENTLTGTNTAPKPTVPFQIERAMRRGLPGSRLGSHVQRQVPEPAAPAVVRLAVADAHVQGPAGAAQGVQVERVRRIQV